MDLPRYIDSWDPEDPHANFKEEVAEHTRIDPLPMLRNLSALTGVPVPALMRYVLVKWGSEGHELILHAGPRMIRRMQAVCEEAAAGGDADRLAAFETLRQMVSWLAVPLEGEAPP